jgi:hypothetical protein
MRLALHESRLAVLARIRTLYLASSTSFRFQSINQRERQVGFESGSEKAEDIRQVPLLDLPGTAPVKDARVVAHDERSPGFRFSCE